jgi:hypothetical protein
MPSGRGYGRGFGFQGVSSPWPYIGRGRGSLSRCWGYSPPGGYYQPCGIRGFPGNQYPNHEDWYTRQGMGMGDLFSSPSSHDEEINYLRNQAQVLKDQLGWIDQRIQEIEKQKSKK